MTTDALIQQLALIITALVTSQSFINYLASKFSKTSKIERAVKALLHDRLSYMIGKHIEAGHVTSEDYRIVNELYEAYRDVGGNGTISHLFLAVQQLKIESKESHE